MDAKNMPDNPYFLLTPGPLSTSKPVKSAMFRDWCTWDKDYNDIVQDIRARLAALASRNNGYTSVLMQGSGTFSVEAAISTAVPHDGKLLVLANGHYGDRIALIAQRMGLEHTVLDSGEVQRPDLDQLRQTLDQDTAITHVAVVHCETTTGMLNPVQEIGRIVKQAGKVYIVDAMSSFGGIPLDMADLGADFIVSSANKCIQGVPGFGFAVAKKSELEQCQGRSRSLSLDMHDQWQEMENKNGKWRYTSPTHVVRAFAQALAELEDEGGVATRFARYTENHRILVEGMRELGFSTLLPDEFQSPIITSFSNPDHPDYDFMRFYGLLKERGFVIYPGKVTGANTFRIGNIGHVFPQDMRSLIGAVAESMYWR
ncbi:MAG: 2-aminoethylphosphonate--pyruvate transaminase [Desulfovibrio sp.]|nr:MAG: 2-aminoethylphosphonate--pyruvate transaminase [Desulfovibrio sp.]